MSTSGEPPTRVEGNIGALFISGLPETFRMSGGWIVGTSSSGTEVAGGSVRVDLGGHPRRSRSPRSGKLRVIRGGGEGGDGFDWRRFS